MRTRRIIDGIFAIAALALAAFDAHQAIVLHRTWFWVLVGVLILFAGYYGRRFFTEGPESQG